MPTGWSAWRCTIAARSEARRSNRISGCRRITPVAEQGASTECGHKARHPQSTVLRLCSIARMQIRHADRRVGILCDAAGARRRRRAPSPAARQRAGGCQGLAARARRRHRARAAQPQPRQAAASCAPVLNDTRPSANPADGIDPTVAVQEPAHWHRRVRRQLGSPRAAKARRYGLPIRARSTRIPSVSS